MSRRLFQFPSLLCALRGEAERQRGALALLPPPLVSFAPMFTRAPAGAGRTGVSK